MIESGVPDVPAVQQLTRLLYSDAMPNSPAATTRSMERVFEALRARLSSVLGVAGYATLLARALTLTRREFAWLAAVTPDENGSLTGRSGMVEQEHPGETERGFAAVLTRFATLLTTFVGADLTNRLLETVWQDLQNNSATENSGANT